jgi:Family of unknown function (DUF6279)
LDFMRVPLPAAMITMSSAMSVPGFGFRSLIIAALCVALSLTSGCSALRIGYATGPDVVYWWIDRYIDFNGEQTPRAREAIAQWFNWHRRTQVPEYAAQLVKAQREVLLDTTAARTCEWQQELVKRARIAFDRIAPAAAELMLTVTPEQVAYLESRYEKFNSDFRDDYLQPDPKKRAKKGLKQVIERAEMLYGRLDDSQRDRIADALTRSPFDPELWLSERKLRQQEVLHILRRLKAEGASRDQALAALRGYADLIEHSPRETYSRYYQRLTEFNCQFAANLHNSTTAAQRRTAVAKLAGWEGDLRHIATVVDPAPS